LPRNTPAGACSSLLAAALLAAAGAAAQETPYAALSRGASCNLETDGSLGCRYVVGRDLEFILKRVAEPGVKMEIVRERAEGDYVIEPSVNGHCIYVRFGPGSGAPPGSRYLFATVSTRNGLVYRTLRECRLAK
jgi:hypothetical protein